MSVCLTAGCNGEAVKRPALFAISGLCEECERISERTSLARHERRPAYTNSFLRMSGVPVKYRDIVATPLSKFAWQTAQKAMQERKGLFLVGEAGSGKTLTMAVLAREILSRGGVLRWENVADLSATLRSAVTGNALLFASTIQILKYAHHLMLDDLGAEQDKTGWFTSVLHQIIDWRYVNDLATSATVNDPSVVDARLLRRLQENAMTVELRKES